uniref:Putative LAGLIDADG homing endonuclease n=1 Tax=Microspora stagnorum TaxID=163317 RepID=U5YGY0_MICSG|nr:putative LAGLIDADG homing endonuclease [Microspora stagnorum]AGZ90351.1 putative LAGLIDADG homing endonuclease [Microspora stagnorum]
MWFQQKKRKSKARQKNSLPSGNEAVGASPISDSLGGTQVPHGVPKNVFFDCVPLPNGSEAGGVSPISDFISGAVAPHLVPLPGESDFIRLHFHAFYRNICNASLCQKNDNSETVFGQYLAGLLEGDGTIIVPDLELVKRRPVVRICFHIKDESLAVFLKDRIGYGHLVYPKTGNYLLLEISDTKGLCRIVNLVNGFFRTPKLEAFERLINWLQQRVNEPVSSKGMDSSPLTSTAWLSGFTDADGNFHVIIAPRKNKKLIRIQTQFRIEVRQAYKRVSSYGSTYWDVVSDIARLLGTNVYARSRSVNETIYYTYFFVASSRRSKTILRE